MLVVDDDATVAEVVLGYLRRAGFEASHAADGPAALIAAEAANPDLVVLDLMLPGLNGLEVCRRLRAARPDLAVVMLTARGEEEDRVLGLQVGADDYVVKPFSPRELVLRVQSVLRRRSPVGPGASLLTQPLSDGDLAVDVAAHRATLRGRPLDLTAREFDLLAYLMTHPGEAFSRERLMHQVWGWTFGDTATVTVHVRRLREKLERDPTRPERVVTVWGVGYRFDASDEPPRDR